MSDVPPRKLAVGETLPAELKYKLMKLLPAPDVRSLMLASKAFYESGRCVLYDTVIYRVSSDETMYKQDMNLLKNAGAGNLSLVRNLAITNTGAAKSNRALPEDVEMNHVGVWKCHTNWSDATRTFNRQLASVLELMTQLRIFRCSHLLPITQPTLAKMMSVCQHIESIQVRIAEPYMIQPNAPIVKHQLKSLGYRGGYDLYQYFLSYDVLSSVFRKVLEQNADTVEEIVLGQECWAAQAYKINHDYLLGAVPWHLDDTLSQVCLPYGLPNLKKLELVCACVRFNHPIKPLNLGDIFKFSALRSLALESCFGLEGLFRRLIKEKGEDTLSLKEFRFRNEDPREEILSAVENFICSFSGLELLSVLIDNTDAMPDHERIFRAHGSTLKVLVWEGRKRRRPLGSISLEKRNADGGPSFLESLPEHCPYLRELSIPLDVNMSYLKESTWNRVATGTPFGILALPHLTTLHIHLLPVANRLAVDPFLILHSNKAAVVKFLDWGNRNRTSHPNLKLIAVGQLTYADRWVLNRASRMRSKLGPVRPFFFDVAGKKNTFGTYDHILQPLGRFDNRLNAFVSETVETVQEDYPNTRIFDSYWLK